MNLIKKLLLLGLNVSFIFIPSQFLFDSSPEGEYTKDLLHVLLKTARKMMTIRLTSPQPPDVLEALTAKLQ